RHTRFSRDWSSDVCSSDLSHAGDRLKDSPGEARTPMAPFRRRALSRCRPRFAHYPHVGPQAARRIEIGEIVLQCALLLTRTRASCSSLSSSPAQDVALSRLKHGFESRWGRKSARASERPRAVRRPYHLGRVFCFLAT